MVLHSFYKKILSIKVISSLNLKVLLKVKLSATIWPELGLIKAE